MTQSISPDLHHKVLYGNPYVAEYQNFMFRSIDNDDELPSVVPTNLSVNNSTKEMSFTIPLSVDVSGVEYVFYGWDDNSAANIDYSNGTVSRSFVLGDDYYNYAMAMSGKYKAHLYSGATFSDVWSVCGTCPNSQRKLDWVVAQTGLASGSDGIYQAVYESSNNVWYTESTDHAQTWRPEILVGAGHRPTIANSSNAAYIAYSGDGEIVTLKYANRNFSDITCQQSAPYASLDAAPAMVIDSTESVVFVVWETTSGELRYAAYVDDDVADVGMIPGTGQYGTPVRPSIGHRQGTQAYHLAWREDEHIIYSEIKIDAYGSQWGGILFKPTVLLSNAGHYAEGAPSVTVNSRSYPAVAWGSWNFTHGRFISFRQSSSAGWGTMATMIAAPPEEYWAPSVAALSDLQTGSDIRIAHNADAAPAVQRLISGSWLVPTSYQALEGLHPNTVEYLPSTFSHEVYAEYSSIFGQSMKGVAFSDEHLDRSHRGTLSSSRELVFSKGPIRAKLRLGELEIQSPGTLVEMDWATGFDTLVVGKTKTIDEYLRTAPFTVPSNGVLKYRYTGKRDGASLLPVNLQLVFEVVDAATQQPVAILQQIPLNTMSNSRIDGNYTLPLTSFGGRNVYVQGRAIGFDTSVQVLAIDYYHNPGSTLPRYAEHVEESIDLPTSVQLAQNFPNPFNPTTTIRYNLPEAANVSLMVTDVYGRIVTEIAQGHKAAGTHSAQWDASGQPSGVYYCTLTAGGSKLTRRMHLVK